MAETRQEPNKEPIESDAQRNRDAEDTRESSTPVRPGSGAMHGEKLPRGGTR